MRYRPPKAGRERHGVIVQEVNNVSSGRLDGRVALSGGLLSPGNDNFQTVRRIIQRAAGCRGLDLGLPRPGGNYNRHEGKIFAHWFQLLVWTTRSALPKLPPAFLRWILPGLISFGDHRRQLVIIFPGIGDMPKAGQALGERIFVILKIRPALAGLVRIIGSGESIAVRAKVALGKPFTASRLEKLGACDLAATQPFEQGGRALPVELVF